MGGGVDDLLQPDVRHAAGKVFGAEGGIVFRLGPEPGRVGVEHVQPVTENAVLIQALGLLLPAELVGPLRLVEGGGFLQDQDGLVKVVQQGGGLGIADAQIFVHGFRQGTAVHHGQVLLHAGGHGRFFLAPAVGQRLAQQGRRIGGGAEQHLPGRAEVELFQGILPALGGQIKAVQAVDLIVPVLDAGGRFHIRGKDIHNIAAHRELSRAVHPVPPGIARPIQGGGQLLPGQNVPGMDGAGVGAELLPGHGVLGQALTGDADRSQTPSHQVAQHPQAAVLVLPGGALDGPQDVVPGREHRRRNAQCIQVGGKPGGLRLAGSDDAEGTVQRPLQHRVHLGAAGSRQPEQGRRTGCSQCAGQTLIFTCL